MLLGKNKLRGPEKFQCYTTLVAPFKIRFTSLFFDIEKEDNQVKLRQYLEIFYNRFVQERCF